MVDSLVVRKQKRRSGAGRALMRAAEDWAASQGASSLDLTVYEFNQTAIAFYRRLGYQNLSRRLTRPLPPA
jgi:diamine N-acetyltransferase